MSSHASFAARTTPFLVALLALGARPERPIIPEMHNSRHWYHRTCRGAVTAPVSKRHSPAGPLASTSCPESPPTRELRGGRLYVDGEWVFLKIGKPLRDFANAASVDHLIEDLPVLRSKGYNCLELNCYWHHFDQDGDGKIDRPLDPLRRLIHAIDAQGMFPCLSVETYAVGGGTIPAGFWERFPDAAAINADGKEVRDTEYRFGTAVPSLFAPAYLNASRRYIRDLVQGLPHEKLLYYETTVEPQYIGNQSLDYSVHARRAYESWLDDEGLEGPPWPAAFPVPAEFRAHPVWNRFRAEALAGWVNGDASAFRDVAGEDAWVAVDYLETAGPEMPNRNGNSVQFLKRLSGINIIQVNWHWHLGSRSPNMVAYENVRAAGRNWAVTEHMTLNGSDYKPDEVAPMLLNTLKNGTRFGWEFVTVSPGTGSAFALYNDDWSPKPMIAEVDDKWEEWMEKVRRDR